jgi:hypothetical protein
MQVKLSTSVQLSADNNLRLSSTLHGEVRSGGPGLELAIQLFEGDIGAAEENGRRTWQRALLGIYKQKGIRLGSAAAGSRQQPIVLTSSSFRSTRRREPWNL